MNSLIRLIKKIIPEKAKPLLKQIMAHSIQVPMKWNIQKYGMTGHSIKLEACTMCQLSCVHCPTVEMLQINELAKDSKGYRKEAAMKSTVGWGSLKFSNFKQLIESNPHIRQIELSSFGEIFLNPDLPLMLKHAYERGITLTAQNGVNLNKISDEMIECLVKYKFRNISVSIDGASQKTYSMYRKGGDFDGVLRNIRRINSLKEKYGSKYPKLLWSFIIFEHNEHEILLAKRIARELGMEFSTQLNCFPYYSPVKDKEFVRQHSSQRVATIDELTQKIKKPVFSACTDLWDCPQINWDGKLLGCCCNVWGDFGNVFKEGLKELLRSERYIYAKQMLLGRRKPREDIPCVKCNRYQDPKERRLVIETLNKIPYYSL